MSLTIEIKDAKGAKAGTFDLPAEIFDVQVNVPLIHQVVILQLKLLLYLIHLHLIYWLLTMVLVVQKVRLALPIVRVHL
ncbi:MAG: hypothetical protein EBX19_08820 [Actinobacteria bacterium]|nr:hypothetical protein [Actinomycetota bacterium]